MKSKEGGTHGFGKVIGLETAVISKTMYQEWKRVVRGSVHLLEGISPDNIPPIIPGEQGRIEDDGSLTIFVTLPSGGEVSMNVPEERWTYLPTLAQRKQNALVSLLDALEKFARAWHHDRKDDAKIKNSVAETARSLREKGLGSVDRAFVCIPVLVSVLRRIAAEVVLTGE